MDVTATPKPPRVLPILLAYTLARLALVLVLTLVLSLVLIPLVAFAFAVAIQLPLAWLVLAPLRRRTTAALAVANAGRRAERARLQAALSGTGVPDDVADTGRDVDIEPDVDPAVPLDRATSPAGSDPETGSSDGRG